MSGGLYLSYSHDSLTISILQGGEERYRTAWKQICEISRRGYNRVYERLGVELEEKVGNFLTALVACKSLL